MRRCACPRKEPMDGMPESIVYRHGDRCHKRAYRDRVKRAAEAAGLEVALSLRAIRATKGTKASAGQTESAKKRAQNRRPELRVSYRKAVDGMTERLAALLSPTPDGPSLDECREIAEQGLKLALPPRALAQVERERAA